MRVGIMITDNGSHPPEKWAAESAAQIADVIVIDPNSIVRDTMTIEKNNFINALKDTLVRYHEQVQKDEISKLKEFGAYRLNTENSPDPEHLDEAVDAVQSVSKMTMFGAHFNKPEVRHFVHQTLGGHFTTVRHTERSWFADKHPESEQTKIFRARK